MSNYNTFSRNAGENEGGDGTTIKKVDLREIADGCGCPDKCVERCRRSKINRDGIALLKLKRCIRTGGGKNTLEAIKSHIPWVSAFGQSATEKAVKHGPEVAEDIAEGIRDHAKNIGNKVSKLTGSPTAKRQIKSAAKNLKNTADQIESIADTLEDAEIGKKGAKVIGGIFDALEYSKAGKSIIEQVSQIGGPFGFFQGQCQRNFMNNKLESQSKYIGCIIDCCSTDK